MPNLTGLPALDVAIGLAFVYFVFSLVASALNEGIASIFALRARFLEKGLRSLLDSDDAVARLANHPLVRSAAKHTEVNKLLPWRRLWPSYLPARTFAVTLLDTFAPPDGVNDSRDELARIKEKLTAPADDDPIKFLPESTRAHLLHAVIGARGEVDRFRKSLETWFDDTMDRVSGWYKRRVQLILAILGLIVVGAFNVDTFQVANTLWNDQTVRTAVVAQAQQQAQAGTSTTGNGKQDLEAAAKNVGELQQLKLPLGWKATPPKGKPADPRAIPHTASGWWGKLGGLLVTAIALTLGAPFWFDLLNRLVRLRNTGPPEGGPRERRPRTSAA